MVELPTRERLAQALEKADAPKWMIDQARQAHYDDFESPLAFPIHQLVEDLVSVNMVEMAQRAMDGEFDSTKAESDAWAKSQEGQGIMSELQKSMKRRRMP